MEQEVHIAPIGLTGILTLPDGFHAVIVFAHGCGSNRSSQRNSAVATALQKAGFGTLLFDMLTQAETQTNADVFDTHLGAERLMQATQFLCEHPDIEDQSIGYFGAASGSAAALIAAARAAEHQRVRAVVSRGGRPDLAEVWLDGVAVPTLLIVGGKDHAVMELNRQALERLHCIRALEVVPGAGHLFEEPGALDAVSASTTAWFTTHLKTLKTE